MRDRKIYPGFFTNEVLGRDLPEAAQLLFSGLWCMADKAGRLKDEPVKIKAAVMPYRDQDVDRLLWMLYANKFIQRYQVAGVRYIAIPNFAYYQKTGQFEAPSRLPDVSEGSLCLPDQTSLSFSLFSKLDQLAGTPPSPAPNGNGGNPYTQAPVTGNGESPRPHNGHTTAMVTAAHTAVHDPPGGKEEIYLYKTRNKTAGWPAGYATEPIAKPASELAGRPAPNGNPCRSLPVEQSPEGTDPATVRDIRISDWPAAVRAIRAVPVWPGDAKVAEVIAAALDISPGITDADLAMAADVVRKPGQKQAGLFLRTIPEYLADRARMAKLEAATESPPREPVSSCLRCGNSGILTPDGTAAEVAYSGAEARRVLEAGGFLCECERGSEWQAWCALEWKHPEWATRTVRVSRRLDWMV